MNWLHSLGSKRLEFHSKSQGYILIIEDTFHKLSSAQVTNETWSLDRTCPLNALTFSELRKGGSSLEIKGEICAQLFTGNITRWTKPMESTE